MGSENLQSLLDDTFKKSEEDGITQIKETIKKMYNIWDEFGLPLSQKSERISKVWEHVYKLLSDILCEENNLYDDIKESVKNCSLKILELSTSLSVPRKEFSGTLLKREESLRQELDSLTKLKNQRIRDYQDLRHIESILCQALNMPKLQLLSSAGIPSEKDLHELEQNNTQLKIEKERRHVKFCRMKKEFTTIIETTEIAPESLINMNVLSLKENFPLSIEILKALEEAIAKGQTKKAVLELKKKDLMDRLSVLWDRVYVQENKRVTFLSEHADCRPSTLKSIQQELERCEKIKRDQLKMFMESLTRELNEMWSKCLASEHQKRMFKFYSASYLLEDEVLKIFDAEVGRWKSYYEDVEHILKKIKKRQELFDLMIAFENKATDPNRFKNRKGNLLKEEKERKKLQKDLPALENEIFIDIVSYEQMKRKPFLYYGENYKDFVTNQWKALKSQRDSERLERQKQHYLQVQNEVTIGTPVKRPIMTTPKSAPSKLLKSSIGLSMQCTPKTNHSRRIIPHTIAKQPTQCTPVTNHSRRIIPHTIAKQPTQCIPETNHSKRLISKTVGKLTKNIRNNNFRPNAIQMKDQKVLRERILPLPKLTRLSPNGTTYTDFANELNSTARCSSRSSVLSTKKPGGTRISLNNSKRKSGSKTLRRSPRNTSKIASNLTPARGKYGLPFLI